MQSFCQTQNIDVNNIIVAIEIVLNHLLLSFSEKYKNLMYFSDNVPMLTTAHQPIVPWLLLLNNTITLDTRQSSRTSFVMKMMQYLYYGLHYFLPSFPQGVRKFLVRP